MSRRQSPLHEAHESVAASMTEFGGWTMPVEFDSIRSEHRAVREGTGRFDVSHMGQIEVSGPDAKPLLQKLTTNDVSALEPGEAQYAAITDESGIMLDDTVVYRLPADPPPGAPGETADYLFVPNAGHDAEMHERWSSYRERWDLDADVENVTDEYGMIAVQGPEAGAVLADLTGPGIRDLERFESTAATVADCPCLIARTGYTGEDGFEIIAPWADTREVWDALDIRSCGLGARDTLRIEMGYLLSGQDFHPEEEPRTPLEAGIEFAVDLDTEFVGRDALLEQQESGLEQTLVGLRLQERGVPRNGYPITDASGTTIGAVTSGTIGPTVEEPIGLGYVDVEFSTVDTPIGVEIRGEPKKGIIVPPPFVNEHR
ncbi:MAG: glycine cleavage system aminomethyltransferase GcvT [Halodesulfurarchaeum sp.]